MTDVGCVRISSQLFDNGSESPNLKVRRCFWGRGNCKNTICDVSIHVSQWLVSCTCKFSKITREPGGITIIYIIHILIEQSKNFILVGNKNNSKWKNHQQWSMHYVKCDLFDLNIQKFAQRWTSILSSVIFVNCSLFLP